MKLGVSNGSLFGWGIAVLGVLICWALAFAGDWSRWIPWVAGVEMMLVLAMRHWNAGLLILLLNPMTVIFSLGFASHMGRTPSIGHPGLAGLESFNLDRETRCFHSAGGCIITGNEWMFPGVRNAGLGMAVRLFGPPSASYHGPYPTKEEALALVQSAPDQEVHLFIGGEVKLRDQRFKLPDDLLDQIESQFGPWVRLGPESRDRVCRFRIQAETHENRCLILRLAQHDLADGRDQEFLILIDLKNMRPFANYNVKNAALPPFGVVPYSVPAG
jgi:hypothetical protein